MGHRLFKRHVLGVPIGQFIHDLRNEIEQDNVSNGAAALAYFLMLAIFPAGIVLLTLLPYLPIPDLDRAILNLLTQVLPAEAATAFTGVVQEVTSQRRGGLLSFGLLTTLWAASNGLYAIMQQLNVTYDVREGRPFWKVRGTALLLMVLFFALLVGGFGLIVFGGQLQSWAGALLGSSGPLLVLFAVIRWLIVAVLLLLGFAVTFYFGPDVEQRFRFVSPGAVLGVIALVLASLGFRFYVSNFGAYAATYGSLGAAIVLLLWLYIAGIVLLLGSEVNALVEHYAAAGKEKGEKRSDAAHRPARGGIKRRTSAEGDGKPSAPV